MNSPKPETKNRYRPANYRRRNRPTAKLRKGYKHEPEPSQDWLSEDGAHELAHRIRAYWLAINKKVDVWVEAGGESSRNNRYWVVRSRIKV